VIEWQPFGAKSLEFIRNPVSQDARINILEGSVRSSKTVTMIPKLLIYCKHGPPGLLLIVGVSKDTVYDNVLRDLFDTVGTSNYSYNRQTGDLTVFGRSIKVIGAKDDGSEKYLRGKTLAGAYVDELTLIPEKFFKQLLNRLSVRGAKLYATTNPDTPSHYIYTEYISDEEKLSSGLVKVIHFVLDDNPNLDEEYKRDIAKSYSGLFYKRFILGLWVMADGAIYDMWTDDNLYDALPFHIADPAHPYDRDVAVDYGTQNPMVFLDILHDGHGVYVENEYHYAGKANQAQKTDSEYADDLDKFTAGKGINQIIVDPSAASFIAELKKRGYRVKQADNDVENGIRLMASMIQLRMLKVNKRCVNFVREVGSYVWDEKARMRGEEKPLKQNDHVMDACRYYCQTKIKKIRSL
jgi:PBSX family phage terminase large subunit